MHAGKQSWDIFSLLSLHFCKCSKAVWEKKLFFLSFVLSLFECQDTFVNQIVLSQIVLNLKVLKMAFRHFHRLV